MQHRKIVATSKFPAADNRSAGQPVRQAPHPADHHVGRQIAVVRVLSDLSQPRLADRVGISYQQLQKYENGKNRVSASMLYELGKVLGVPAGRFFDGLPGNVSTAGDVPQLPADERINFIASAEGRRLVEGLMQLRPAVRTRLSSLIAMMIKEMAKADGASRL